MRIPFVIQSYVAPTHFIRTNLWIKSVSLVTCVRLHEPVILKKISGDAWFVSVVPLSSFPRFHHPKAIFIPIFDCPVLSLYIDPSG